MKKYISPAICVMAMTENDDLLDTVSGFTPTLDDDNVVDADKVLSRRSNSIWDDEE